MRKIRRFTSVLACFVLIASVFVVVDIPMAMNVNAEETGEGSVDGDYNDDFHNIFNKVYGPYYTNGVEIKYRGGTFMRVGPKSAPTFADLDGDGDLDLTVGVEDGNLVYLKNTGTAQVPEFTENTSMFEIYIDGIYEDIDVGKRNKPAFADLDNDGDYDLTIGNSTGHLRYYINTGTTEAPSWTYDGSMYFGIDIGYSSSPTFADLDNDGDYDLTVGESDGILNYYRNTGTREVPSWTHSSGMFSGIAVGYNSAPTFADVDTDGDFDLTIGCRNGILNYYENIGTATSPEWEENSSMLSEIDIHKTLINSPLNEDYTTPTFVDLDDDNDLDLMIGEDKGFLNYFENIGKSKVSSWRQNNIILLGIHVTRDSFPTFADLDNDGDYDLIIGDQVGKLNYYENTGTITNPEWAYEYSLFSGIDIGSNSGPAFADLDNDGDLDLTIGENDGILNYYENTGDNEIPSWIYDGSMFSGIDIGSRSAPAFKDLDNDGDYDLTIGESDGILNYYENTGDNMVPSWTYDDSMFSGIDVGSRSAPAFEDLDNDGDYDLTIGENDGILNYYENTGTAQTPSWERGTSSLWEIDIGSSSSPTFIDLDADDDLDLIIGESGGLLNYFENIGKGEIPSWTEEDSIFLSYSEIDIGSRAPSFGDLDNDGDFDLIVGGYYYENIGSAEASAWKENISIFPGINVGNNPAISDLDNDGDLDLITGDLRYYENTGTSEVPEWTKNNSMFLGIDIGSYGRPTFADLDNDGDLDLIIGRYDGTLKYYENTGTVEEPEWSEDTSTFSKIDVGVSNSPAFADLNNDGDFDLIIGEKKGTLNYFENTGNTATPEWTYDRTIFSGIDVGDFSKPALADLDNDGDYDLVVGERDGDLNYYENIGTAVTPSFFTHDDLMFSSIDIGLHPGIGISYSTPAFADLDNDGDLDMTVGEDEGRLFYYENIGTASNPEWLEYDSMFSGLQWGTYTETYSAPTFADLDNDGDFDLTIGKSDGKLKYYENAGSPEIPEWIANTSMFSGMDTREIGSNSKPAFVDFDNDGDFDLAIGDHRGELHYYNNTGSRETPEWTYIKWYFEGIVDITQAAPVFADLDNDGDFDLALGEYDDRLFYYENIGTAMEPKLKEYPSMFSGIYIGLYSTPTFADLDDDGDLDLIVGERDGNLNFYENKGFSGDRLYIKKDSWFDVGTQSTPSFADLDDDGDLDLVMGCYWYSYLFYYENIGTPYSPSWRKDTTMFSGMGAAESVSAPTFADLDNDGDFDLIVGKTVGRGIGQQPIGILVFYENTGTTTVSEWTEDPSMFSDLELPGGIKPVFADLDNDGDLDLTIGKPDGCLIYYKNIGTASNPEWLEHNSMFSGIDVGSKSAPTFEDLDNDGDSDLIVGESGGTLHSFENIGTKYSPSWKYDTTSIFWGIDVGSSSVPTFADINNDRNTDLFIGEGEGKLNYFENWGRNDLLGWAQDSLMFSEIDFLDYELIDEYFYRNNYYNGVAFGDLDNDEDLDIAIGITEGTLLYYENTGTIGNPEWIEDTSMFSGIDVGSYSSPVFADLDNDGDLDLIIGEFNGYLKYYRNIGTVSSPEWTEDTSMFSGIDVGSYSRPAFADLDNDGDLDLIIGGLDGNLNYYKNIGTVTSPEWTEDASMFFGIDVGYHSAPAFADLDNDGDYDLILGKGNNIYHEGDGIISYYKNTGTTQVPEWTYDNSMFHEIYYKYRRATTPAFADLDHDGDFDFTIGGSCEVLNYYKNTGSSEVPEWTDETDIFSLYAISMINIGLDITPTFKDLDNDGDLDLTMGERDAYLNYFENTGTVDAPEWTENKNNFRIINFYINSESAPAFADLDNDGDLDLTLGARYTLKYYENIGSAEFPEWTENISMFSEIDISSYRYLKPTFEDLDNDEDYDLIIGKSMGQICYYNNTGSLEAPSWTYEDSTFSGIDVGSRSAPAFADLDGDGDLDLTIGEYSGMLKYYENIGTAEVSSWMENKFMFSFLSGIDLGSYSSPTLADLDNNGILDLFIGESSGKLYYFKKTGIQETDLWIAEPSMFAEIHIDSFSSFAFWDSDNDGDLDITSGQNGGKLIYYQNVGSAEAPSWIYDNLMFSGIDIGSSSAPAFADLDDDGDYDLTIGEADGELFYYENTGTAEIPLWSIDNSFFSEIDIGDNSIPTFADLDDDGDYDLVIGGSSGKLFYYENIGTAKAPLWGYDESVFSKIVVEADSAPAFADLDNDGDLDLVVGELNYYINTGTAKNPQWTSQTKTNINMFSKINVGSYNTPAFADLDNDGDSDLILVNPNLRYFENKGSIEVPIYSEDTYIFSDIYDRMFADSASSIEGQDGTIIYDKGVNEHVSFADLDNDGDLDLIKAYYSFVYYEIIYMSQFYLIESSDLSCFINIGTSQTPIWEYRKNMLSGIDFSGFRGRPTFADIDNDGDLDFIYLQDPYWGSKKLIYYRNIGTAETPEWKYEGTLIPQLDTGTINFAIADLDNDGDLDLLTGDMLFYENTGTPEVPEWTARGSMFYPIIVTGEPAFVDMDNDGDFDLIINSVDYLNYFENTGTAEVPELEYEMNMFEDGDIGGIYRYTFADIDNDGDFDLTAINAYHDIFFFEAKSFKADAGGPYVTYEGTEIEFDASASSGFGDAVEYRWDFENDGVWDTEWSSDPTALYTWYDDHSGEVRVEVYDGKNLDTAITAVNVNNVAPIVDIDEDQIINIENNVSFIGIFTDPGTEDTHTIHLDFGDGNTTEGTLTPTHRYINPGKYTVTITITDDDGGIGQDTIILLVGVYNIDKDSYYLLIQEAIYNADPCDTCIVGRGTYNENLVIDKPLTLWGMNNKKTVIQTGTGNGISINDQSDVTIQNLNITGFDNGIRIDNSDNITISGNTITGNNHGILSSTSEYVTITNNRFSDNTIRGIRFYETSNSLVKENTVERSDLVGISIHSSDNVVIDDNNVSYNSDGIKVENSLNTTITENMVSHGDNNGIQCKYSGDITLIGNTVTGTANCAISLDYSGGSTVTGNTVTDTHYGMILGHSDGLTVTFNTVTRAGIDLYYSGNSTLIGNTVTEANIRVYSSSGSTLTENTITTTDGSYGIHMYYSHGCTFARNAVTGSYFGIKLLSSSGSNLTENTVTGSIYGINLVYSNDSAVTGNSVTGGVYAIRLDDTCSSTLAGNTITGAAAGITLDHSDGCTITDNTILDNEYSGFYICYSEGNNISRNLVIEGENGFHLVYANNNSIYHNNMINNTKQLTNIYSTNKWDNGAGEGNYWSDYTGLDDGSNGRVAGDGIGDTEIPHPYIDIGAVSYWKFDEGSGGIASDSVGSYDGTLEPSGPIWTTGQIGGALSFDGVDDYIEVSDSTILDITDKFTIEMWIKPASTQKTYTDLLDKKHSPGSAESAWVVQQWGSTNNKYCFAWYDSGTWYGWDSNKGYQLTANVFQHFSIVFSSGNVKMYHNGVKILEYTETSTTLQTNNYPLTIGANTEGLDRYFNGIIDELAIYDKALTPNEIQDHYNLGLTGIEITPDADTIGLWHLDEGSGSTATDSSTNNNHGSLMPMVSGPIWTTGQIGGALSFDGVDDYVNVPHVFSGNGDITMSAWINFEFSSPPKYPKVIFIGKPLINQAIQIFQMTGSGQLGVGKWGGSNAVTSESYNDGEWHYVVGRYYNGNTYDIFVDGEFKASNTGTYNIPSDGVTWIGGRPGPYNVYTEFWDGLIDEVVIYDRFLTANEIQDHYNLGLDGFPISVFMIDYYPLTSPKNSVHNIDTDEYFDTINEAINNADPYDTIFVGFGRYFEYVVIDKPLILIGEDNENTIILGTGGGNGILVNGQSDVTIQNLNITGFYSNIYMSTSDNILIIDSTISESTWCGIYGINSNIIEVENNHVINNKWGLAFQTSENISITENIIINTEKNGINLNTCNNNLINNNIILNNNIGIKLEYCNYNTIMNNNVSNNSAYGLFYGASENNTITNNIFSYASSCIYTQTSRYDIITNNIISNASAWGLRMGDARCGAINNNDVSGCVSGFSLGDIHHTEITNNKILENSYSGISLIGSHNLICNNEFSKKNGLFLQDSNDNTIEWNTFYEGGITIYTSTRIMISNNTIFSSPGKGITLWATEGDITLIDNVIKNTEGGIFIYGNCQGGVRVLNNIVSYNDYGICSGADDSEIVGNMVTYSNVHGIYFEVAAERNNIAGNTVIYNGGGGIVLGGEASHGPGSHNNTIYNNTVSHNLYGIGIGSDLNTVNDNTVMDNQGNGITLKYATNNLVINNIVINNHESGIAISGSSYITITGNTVSGNDRFGISIYDSNNNTVTQNIVTNCDSQGIRLWHLSNYNTISENIVTDNKDWGIRIWQSSNNTISGNTISGNIGTGMYVDLDANNNIIIENLISGNDYGLVIITSTENTVEKNTIQNNNVGLNLHSSDNNSIFYNNIINNLDQLVNSYSANTWHNDEGEGNYWSDYIGLDDSSHGRIAGDGIGDTDLPHPYVDTGAVSYWRLDEGSGTTTYDFISSNDGTVYEATWTTGQVGNAIEFDGVNDYVDLTQSSLNNIPDWTFSAWIYPRNLNHGIIYSEGIPEMTFQLRPRPDGSLYLAVWNLNHPNRWMTYSTPTDVITANEWNYIAVTLQNGYVNSGELMVYVNGNSYTGIIQRQYNPNTVYAAFGRNVGSIHGGSQGISPFNGIIDEVAIYNRTLYPVEIQQLYSLGLEGKPVSTTMGVDNCPLMVPFGTVVVKEIEVIWEKEPGIRVDTGSDIWDFDNHHVLDPEVIQLPDGSYRMYYTGVQNLEGELMFYVLSALSSDGSNWTKETGARIRVGRWMGLFAYAVGHSSVITLTNGTYRMYFSSWQNNDTNLQILSAVSPDGFTWEIESGIRLDIGGDYPFGGDYPSGDAGYPEVVELSDGSFRMYYTAKNVIDGNYYILSAFSDDGLYWTKESGVRISSGGIHDPYGAAFPEVMELTNGSYRMYYSGRWQIIQSSNTSYWHILSAFSSDGITWTKEDKVSVGNGLYYDSHHADTPEIVTFQDWTIRMYYTGWDYEHGHKILSAVREVHTLGVEKKFYASIQEAVDDAEVGSTIKVGRGTYNESVVIDKPLILIGDSEWSIIQGSGSGTGIYMNGISGVTIESLQITGFSYGIKLDHSSNNHIINNIIQDNEEGIRLMNSHENTIVGNILSENDEPGIIQYKFGIKLVSSNFCTISNNIASNNGYGGIGIYYSDDITISGNILIGNKDGIWVTTSNRILISGNNASSNIHGIQLQYSEDSEISGNTILNNEGHGLSLNYYNNSVISENTISSTVLYYGIYLRNSWDSTIINNEISGNIRGINLVYSNDITINQNIITGGNHGIWMEYSENNNITWNFVSENLYGIYAQYSPNSNIVHNTFKDNDRHGVNIGYSEDTVIDGNTISDNKNFGIHLGYSNNCFIIWNNITNSGWSGIDLYHARYCTIDNNLVSYSTSRGIIMRNSRHCDIKENTVSYNEDGIHLYGSEWIFVLCNSVSYNYIGIHLIESISNFILGNILSNNIYGIVDPFSNNNTISNNIITNNEYGIYIEDSQNNTISNNTLSENEQGLYLDENSTDNEIYHNNFIDNKVQAEDDGNNTWNDGNETGNFWSDYDGKDQDNDGVGDKPYGGLDQFPIIEPSTDVAPVADADGPYFGLPGKDITFDASDSFDCNDEDELQYRWDFDNDGIWDTAWSTDPTATHSWDDEYEGAVVVEVTDGTYFDTDSSMVTVKTLEATIVFDPETLNLLSEGQYVTVYIELPKKYDVEDIDLETILLNGEVPVGDWPWEIGDEDGDKIPDLKVKLDRSAVQDILKVGEYESIVITGQLEDGTWFGGEDRIRVIKEAE